MNRWPHIVATYAIVWLTLLVLRSIYQSTELFNFAMGNILIGVTAYKMLSLVKEHYESKDKATKQFTESDISSLLTTEEYLRQHRR